MKAVVINRYGSIDELTLVDLPTPPLKDGEVLVRNKYASVNPWDYRVRNGSMKMFTGKKFPKILGVESSGVVHRVGKKVEGFKKGDRVIVSTGIKTGSYAEYVAVSPGDLSILPENLSFKEGATLPIAGTTAYNALHELGNIQKESKVLINGAYGGVGIMAVQLASLAGADVTAVCSTKPIEKVRKLGANTVIDYTTQDVYGIGEHFDLIFDTVGSLSFRQAKA